MKIALYKAVGGGYFMVWDVSMGGGSGIVEGYVRTSEWIDVEFSPRESKESIAEEVHQLDVKADEIRATMGRQLIAIETAKANLLAISDQRSSVAEEVEGPNEYVP
jgi:single-stranded DNA-binding protein